MSVTLHQTLFRSEKVRFGAVGAINTIVDFSILFLMVTVFTVPTIVANIISTSAALGVSFLLNKKAVFKSDSKGWKHQLALFVGVTLTGLWGLQSIVIFLAVGMFEQLIGHTSALLLAKIVATLTSLVWNYMWYSRVVFRKKPS